VLFDGRETAVKLRLGALLMMAALLVGALALAARRGHARRVMLPAMSLLCLLVAIDCWQSAGPRDNALLALPLLMLAAAIGSATPRQLLLLLGLNLANVAALYAAATTGLLRFDDQSVGFTASLTSLLLLAGAGLLVVLLVRDLRQLSRAWARELQRAEASSERAAYLLDHDPLTGLPNRACAQRRLRAAAQPDAASFALMLIDIDDFGAINAALGQQVGDEVLCHLAATLGREMQAPDFAARFGDDEFLLLWQRPDSIEGAEAQGRRLLGQLGAPWEALDLAMQVRPLAGMAWWPQDGRDADALLAAAQQALAAAKRDHARPLRLACEAEAGSEISTQRGGGPEWLCLPWQRLDGGQPLAVELQGAVQTDLPLPALLAQVRRQLEAAARYALAWRLAGHAGLALRQRLPRGFLKRGEVEVALQQVLDGGGLVAADLQLVLDLDTAAEDPQALADLLEPLLRKGLQLYVELDELPAGVLPPLAPLPLSGLLLSATALDVAMRDAGALAAWRALGQPLQAAGVVGEAQLRCARQLGCHAVAAQPLEFLVLLDHLAGASR
jgi:diguanylate cyclase (GGDEF)-like protein